MSVARTNIINFFSEEECDKYYALHKEFLKTLSDCGIKEATYVRASPTSLLYFWALLSPIFTKDVFL